MDISLFHRLSYLFGTEKYLEIRRELVLLREQSNNESLASKTFSCLKCSGSIGEGVTYPKSDDDIMVVQCDNVVESLTDANYGDYLMVPSEFPGYCLLLDVFKGHDFAYMYVANGVHFISSTFYKESHLKRGETIHGPCLSTLDGCKNVDLARIYPLTFWPLVAHEWVMRNRKYGWPSDETINNILANGCHVVPIGHPDSVMCQHEWRLSFSVGERTLMHSLNHVQFLTYNLLRLTLKRLIEKKFPGVLCSYFMKTALFYSIENSQAEIWQAENLEICFKTCISILRRYVDDRYCPNYFIQASNMIRQKVNLTNQRHLLELLGTIHSIGIYGVLHLGGESGCVLSDGMSLTDIERKLDAEFLSSTLFDLSVHEIARMFFELSSSEQCIFFLCKFSRLLECCTIIKQQKFTNQMLTFGITYYCEQLMNCLSRRPKINRRDYHAHKTLESLLRLGYRGDITTGKLTMASYMYLLGRTNSALYLIRQLLSEYPPFAINRRSNEIQFSTYTDVMCGRGYTINDKAKRAWIFEYSFFSYFLDAFPVPLRILIAISVRVIFAPLLYAYLLEGLCYVRLQRPVLIKKAISSIINQYVDTEYLSYHSYGKMCIGIIRYAQGDNHSACRWFWSLYSTMAIIPQPFKYDLTRSILIYAAFMLNRHYIQERNRINRP